MPEDIAEAVLPGHGGQVVDVDEAHHNGVVFNKVEDDGVQH